MPLPLVHRPATGRLMVRMAYRPDNRAFLSRLRIRPDWDSGLGCWLVSRDHFHAIINALIARYGEVTVLTDGHRNNRCDTRCRVAVGDDCQCECAGSHHGEGLDGDERIVGATTIVDDETTRWARVLKRPITRARP